MAMPNKEKQARYRVLNEMVLIIYEEMSGVSRHEIRKIAKRLMDFSAFLDMEDYKDED